MSMVCLVAGSPSRTAARTRPGTGGLPRLAGTVRRERHHTSLRLQTRAHPMSAFGNRVRVWGTHPFPCARCRAGLCDSYRLGRSRTLPVSMPSMSGRAASMSHSWSKSGGDGTSSRGVRALRGRGARRGSLAGVLDVPSLVRTRRLWDIEGARPARPAGRLIVITGEQPARGRSNLTVLRFSTHVSTSRT